jgi:hypothetical protein
MHRRGRIRDWRIAMVKVVVLRAMAGVCVVGVLLLGGYYLGSRRAPGPTAHPRMNEAPVRAEGPAEAAKEFISLVNGGQIAAASDRLTENGKHVRPNVWYNINGIHNYLGYLNKEDGTRWEISGDAPDIGESEARVAVLGRCGNGQELGRFIFVMRKADGRWLIDDFIPAAH